MEKRHLIISVIILILTVLIVMLVVRNIRSLYTLHQKLQQRDRAISELKNLVKSEMDIKRQIGELRELIGYYEQKLPKEKEVSQLFHELDNIASGSKIKFSLITPDSSEEGKHYMRYYRTIELKSGYHQLGNFINKLENLGRFIKVDKIAITPDPADPFKHNVELVVSTFVSLEEK